MSFLRTTRNSLAVCAAMATAACGAALAGCGAAQAGDATAHPAAAARAMWPARMVLAEPGRLGIVSQVIDPRTKTAFALTSGAHGSFTLRRTALAGGQVKIGPVFPVDSIALANGSLWVFGARAAGRSALLRLYRVNPRTLHVELVRRLGPFPGASGQATLTPGTHGTIWVSFARTVMHLNARTGARIASALVPVGLIAGDIALSPSGRFLYVATSPPTGGGYAPVLEYQTASLRKLAVNTKTVGAANVGGGTPTAAPGGVWVSARGGMEGRTVLLRQRDLRSVRLPGARSPHGLYSWVMWESTAYSTPSLYLSTYPIQSRGAVAGCVNPRTGHIRARGSVAGHRKVDGLLGFAQHGRVLYAAVPHGIIAIRPPVKCRMS
jgi:hypothetical protein